MNVSPVSRRIPPRFVAGLGGVPEPLLSFLVARVEDAPGYVVPVRHLSSAWRFSLSGRDEHRRYCNEWFRQATRTMLQGIDPGTGRYVFANLRWRTDEWRPSRDPLVLDGKMLVVGRSLRTRLKTPARASSEKYMLATRVSV